MRTSWSAFGFMAVAALIGVLEWQSQQLPERNELVITGAQRAFVREQVLASAQKGPGAGNEEDALNSYIDEEILYREGLKLGLERDDLIVKRRVVQKMRFLLEDMTPIAAPTREQLETWLTQNSGDYQTGEKIRFEHYFFSRGKRGDEAVYQAEAARNQLIAGQQIQADPFALNAASVAIDRDQVIRELGMVPANQLFKFPVGEWSPPVQSALGVHLFKVIERVAGRTMTVNEAGSQLYSDLVAAQREEVNQAGMAALRQSYRIVMQP